VSTVSGSFCSRSAAQTRSPSAGAGGQADQRRLQLRSPAAAEQPADHPGDRDDVGRHERLRPARVGDRVEVPGQHVLARAVAPGHAGADVRVDPGEVPLQVGPELGAAGAQPVDLGLEVGLPVRRVAPDALLQRAVAGCATRERGELAPAEVAHEIHEEQPVLGPGVAGAEHRAGPGAAVDVRHAGSPVPHDHHVGAGPVDPLDLQQRHPERGVVVEGAELALGQAGVPVPQAGVLAELVGRVRRAGTEHPVRQDVGEGGVAVLPGREDVVALPLAEVRGGAGRARRSGQREQDSGGEDGRRYSRGDASVHERALLRPLRLGGC
jgi:hypothetical protein